MFNLVASMKKMREPIRTLLIEAAKMSGLRNAEDTLVYIEERHTLNVIDEVKEFFEWVVADRENRSYGYGNIDSRWLEFQAQKK